MPARCLLPSGGLFSEMAGRSEAVHKTTLQLAAAQPCTDGEFNRGSSALDTGARASWWFPFNLSLLFPLQSEHFSFLGINNQSNLTDMRCRTTFYTALGRLLMVDLGTRVFSLEPERDGDFVVWMLGSAVG